MLLSDFTDKGVGAAWFFNVDAGETLTESDMEFLERVLEDGRSIEGLVKRHPEVQPLVAKVTGLYHDIVAKGLENESKSAGR